MTKTKHLFVTRQYFLGTFAKYAVAQSPYPRPENLEIVIDKLNKVIDPLFKASPLEVAEFDTFLELEQYLSGALRQIPEYVAWNDSKNGYDSPMQFISAYDAPGDPDDDFVDLDALERNVTNEIEREQSE